MDRYKDSDTDRHKQVKALTLQVSQMDSEMVDLRTERTRTRAELDSKLQHSLQLRQVCERQRALLREAGPVLRGAAAELRDVKHKLTLLSRDWDTNTALILQHCTTASTALKQEVQRLQGELQSEAQSLLDLSRDLREKEASLSSCQQRCESLQQQLSMWKRKEAETRRELEGALREGQRIRDEREALKDAQRDERQKTEHAFRKRLEEERSKWRRDATLGLDIERQKNEQLIHKYQGLQDKLPTLVQSAVRELKEEVASLKERLREREEEMKEVASLKERLREREEKMKEVASLKERLREREFELTRLKERLREREEELKEEVTSLKECVREREGELTSLKQRLREREEELKEEVTSLKECVREREGELTSLKEHLRDCEEEMMKEVTSQKERLREREEELKHMRDQALEKDERFLREQHAEVTQLRHKLRELQQEALELQRAHRDVQELQMENSTLREENCQLQETVRRECEERAELTAALSLAREQLLGVRHAAVTSSISHRSASSSLPSLSAGHSRDAVPGGKSTASWHGNPHQPLPALPRLTTERHAPLTETRHRTGRKRRRERKSGVQGSAAAAAAATPAFRPPPVT
ncbi:trichohyalin-like [Clarias gariepinus]|uniref:trichohyalin-like n=1 Tax=Clarias gariepinus TaxID=13013 RepID=UPI00234D6182|nr:trichohyalin-like [Clarias gariepinus]